MVMWSCLNHMLFSNKVMLLFIPAFVSIGSDFVLVTPSLVPRLDTSVDATLLLCESMSYFSSWSTVFGTTLEPYVAAF